MSSGAALKISNVTGNQSNESNVTTDQSEESNITTNESNGPALVTISQVPEGVTRLAIDIGTGYHPLQVNYTDTMLILIEPQQKAVDMLRKKFADCDRTFIIQAAVSDFEGTANLSHFLVEGRMSSLNVPKGWARSKPNKQNFEVVNVTTLARIISSLPLEHFNNTIDYLQVDAQGEDFKIISSAGRLIKAVNNMTVEVYEDGFATYQTKNRKHADWAPLMKKMGFRMGKCMPGFHKMSGALHAQELHCTYTQVH